MMKVLIVCSGNNNRISPFIQDQIDYLVKNNIEVDVFLILGKGSLGYIKNIRKLNNKIWLCKPDLIHAHYGLAGLLAGIQRKVPVVVTFHGSDVNIKKNRFFSKIACVLSKAQIFVSEPLKDLLKCPDGYIIPCGVDLELFMPKDKISAKQEMSLKPHTCYILFSSSFSNKIKNYELAKSAVDLIGEDIVLLELKGYSRREVSLLMNAADLVVLSSFSEGSPQFVKEAMACNRPVVSTMVGDVAYLMEKTEGMYLSSFEVGDFSDSIRKAIAFSMNKEFTDGRLRIEKLGLTCQQVALKLIDVYKSFVPRSRKSNSSL